MILPFFRSAFRTPNVMHRIWLLLPLFCVLASAQEPTEPVPENAPKKILGRKAWFLCTAIPEDIENPVKLLIENQIQEVTLSIRHMSEPFPVRGDGVVKIVKEIPDPEKPGAILYETLAQARVPEGMEKALIILVPAPDRKEGKQAFLSRVLNLNDFRGGDYLYLNLSPRKVGVTLGDERSVLKPGELKIQENRDIKAANNQVLSMHYHSPSDDRWKMIVATTVVVQPTRREICIFHWDDDQKRIDFRGATFPVEMD